jgi:hypothetical protein
MRKSLWFTSGRKTSFAGGEVRIGIIALACLFLSATGARANTIDYTYTGNDFTLVQMVQGPYTTSDSVMGTIVLSAPLPANLPSGTDESALLVSYSFSDGVQTLTNLDSHASFFLFGTSPSGAITLWNIIITNTPNLSEIATSNNTNFASDFGTIGSPTLGLNEARPGVWSGPVGAVPEPGTLSMLFSGLLGLAMLVGVKRYRGNRLATIA